MAVIFLLMTTSCLRELPTTASLVPLFMTIRVLPAAAQDFLVTTLSWTAAIIRSWRPARFRRSKGGVRTGQIHVSGEIAHGRISVSRIRDVQIEDLLGREPVELDDENLHGFLSGKTVMVTGAGGSIGSELVRQIVGYEPKQILLVERAEFFLFQIGRELEAESSDVKCLPLIADVGDEPRMR